MISTAKVKSFFIEAGKRVIKVLQFGAKTAPVVSAFGDDAAPLEGMTAIYAETTANSQPYIIGYINTDHLAELGEKRIYSKTAAGELAAFVWCKNTGDLQLNGADHTAVRFAPLNTALANQNLKINQELAKIALAIGSVGGSYTVAPFEVDISNAESKKVKLK